MTSSLIKIPLALPSNAPTLHHLPDGLTVIAQQIPIEAVNLSLWVNVGSAVESDVINGMAHFLEHMVFKGTKNLQEGEFERRIEERGAITNAATSQDYTHYYITTAPKDFPHLAPLLFDVVFNPSIPDEAFERERLVVLEEIRRSEDNPRRRAYHRAMKIAFEKLPYRRPILGPISVIEQLQPQQMRDFHACYYQPQSITAVVVGNLPVEKLIAITTEGFAQAYSPQKLTISFQDSELVEEPPFEEVVCREYIDENLQQARLIMVWRVPGMKRLQETYALDVLASILGHGRTSRLIQDLREEKGLVSQVSVSNMTHRLQGVFYVSAQLPEKNISLVRDVIISHIRKLQEELVSEVEKNRVSTQVVNRFIFSNEILSERAGLYGYYQSMIGDLAPALNYPALIQALEAEDLQRAAQQYLSPDAFGITIAHPHSRNAYF